MAYTVSIASKSGSRAWNLRRTRLMWEVIVLSSTMLSVAVGWHIYQATGNPFDLALVGLMQIIPIAGLFIVSGWVVDHLQRKYILVA